LISTEIGDLEQCNDYCVIFAVAELFVHVLFIICPLELIDSQSCRKLAGIGNVRLYVINIAKFCISHL